MTTPFRRLPPATHARPLPTRVFFDRGVTPVCRVYRSDAYNAPTMRVVSVALANTHDAIVFVSAPAPRARGAT